MPDKIGPSFYATMIKNDSYSAKIGQSILDQCMQLTTNIFRGMASWLGKEEGTRTSELKSGDTSWSFANIRDITSVNDIRFGSSLRAKYHSTLPLFGIDEYGKATSDWNKIKYVMTYEAASYNKEYPGDVTQARRNSKYGYTLQEGSTESFKGLVMLPKSKFEEYASQKGSIQFDIKDEYLDDSIIGKDFVNTMAPIIMDIYNGTDYYGTIGKSESFDPALRGTKPEVSKKVKMNPFMEAMMKGAKAGNRQVQNTIDRGNNPDGVPTSISLKGINEKLRPYYIDKMERNVEDYQNYVDRFRHIQITIEHRR